MVDSFLADNHHCYSSIVGKSESYNEQFRVSPATEFCRAFVTKNEELCEQFDEKDDGADDDDLTEEMYCKEFKKTFFWESSRKSLAAAVWGKLAIEEAVDRGILDDTFFGPKVDSAGNRVSFKESLHQFMDDINKLR